MRRILAIAFLLLLCAFSVWSYQNDGIMSLMFEPNIEPVDRLTRIQDYFASWGLAAPLGYMLLVAIETILAPIPGAVLYMPGGALFGWFFGGTLSLTGNIIGSGIACQIMRALGRSRLERFLEDGSIKKYQTILEKRGIWIIFVLRVNPFTSSDFVSYAAGLTRLPVWKVMFGTFLGMTPLCYLQSYFAEELLTTFPRLVYPLILIGVAYGVYVAILVRRLARRSQPS
jgi:uncharacterized membrane protein YdjX (TVP38/TMEM64 family)